MSVLKSVFMSGWWVLLANSFIDKVTNPLNIRMDLYCSISSLFPAPLHAYLSLIPPPPSFLPNYCPKVYEIKVTHNSRSFMLKKNYRILIYCPTQKMKSLLILTMIVLVLIWHVGVILWIFIYKTNRWI